MEINGKTQMACLMGHPVEHSFSPYIHNYLAERYGVDLRYVGFDVAPDCIEEAVKGIRALGIIGSNVTIPHKIKVMEGLDHIDKNAEIIGAVNTIKNEAGQLIGYNTDGVGFVKSVKAKGHELKGKTVMLLGAGGACRAIAVELASQQVKKIIIKNNTIEKSLDLLGAIKTHFEDIEVDVEPLRVTQEELRNVDFLINTTPLGMSSKKDLCPIDEKIVPPSHLVVCDIVYTPHETKLLSWASEHNLQMVHGIGMLINQALQSFYIWTGIDVTNAYNEVFHLLEEKGVIKQ